MDLDELRAAGLYDPDAPRAAERAELLFYLVDELGCTLAEMQRANARGRLFALSGDRMILPGSDEVTLREAAAELACDPALLQRGWRALGLPDRGLDEPVASRREVAALPVWVNLAGQFGEDVALSTARAFAASCARMGEATSSTVRSRVTDLALGQSGSEVATARAYASVAGLVTDIATLVDVLLRRHLDSARAHFDSGGDIDPELGSRVRFGVAFADLCGFTSLSGELTHDQLSKFMAGFEDAALDVVAAAGGRVVKFIGDAVMFVASRPEALARACLGLAEHPAAHGMDLQVRVGADFGVMLPQEGDYFGAPVNLASRLVALALPGEVLITGALADALDPATWVTSQGEPTMVRGFSDPVTPVRLQRGSVGRQPL